MRLRLAAAVLCAAALATISCGGVVDPSKNITETFSGTLDPAGAAAFPFSTSQSGEYSVKITALAPNTNVFLIVTYGLLQSGQCAPIAQNYAGLNVTALSGAITPGTWCVAVQDSGVLSASETFTVSVAHP